jgi:outer membrane protein TolC
MKKLIICVIAAVLMTMFTGFSREIYAQESERVVLSDLVREAVEHNPKIQEAYYMWKAAGHKIKTERSLDEPMVSYMLPGGEDVQTRVGPQEKKYTLSQKIPFPNKLRLKGKAQAKESQILKEQYEAVKNEIIKDVNFTYYDLFWAQQAIQINEEEKSILEKLEKVAQRKYESNLIPQQDVIKVQVELSNIIQKLLLLRQNKESLAVRLNSLLDRPLSAKVGSIPALEEVDFSYGLPALIEMVGSSRQELVMANLSIEKAEYEKSLAKMAYLPDFTIEGNYIEIGDGMTTNENDGQDAWSGMVAVDVPIWFGKLRSQVREKEAALQAARQQQINMGNSVEFEVQDIYFKINAYKEIALLYETALIPQAEQAFDASQTGFETGAISFLDWLDTERTFLQTRLAYYQALADFHKSIALLERIVGGSLKGGDHEL